LGRAKDIIVKPITVQDARRIIRSIHYSGKVDTRSKLHFGVFLDGKCGGAIQLGDPMVKHKVLGTVKGTPWSGFLDLHRLAFADWLPRNSESRAIACMMRLIKKHYPWIEWIQSYADAAQCGDGTIYRASGFFLIGIKKNTSMYRMPDGEVCCSIVFKTGFGGENSQGKNNIKAKYGKTGSADPSSFLKSIGAIRLPGFQLRYIYFLDPTARERLTVPIIPFSEIEKRGAKMYKGKRPAGEKVSRPANQPEVGGSIPTAGLEKEVELQRI